jgi:hypothetical protein
LCHYAINASRSKAVSSLPQGLKDRLENLESLVSSLVSGDSNIQDQTHSGNETIKDNNEILTFLSPKQGSLAKPTATWEGPNKGEDIVTQKALHLQETKGGQVNYVDPSHWQAILEDIKEVRDHISVLNHTSLQSEPNYEIIDPNSDPSMIFGSISKAELTEILSSLPLQPICDMLLSWYFNSRFMILGMTDRPTVVCKVLTLIFFKELYIPSSFKVR